MSKDLEVELSKDGVKLSAGKEPTQALTSVLGDIFGPITESLGIVADEIKARRKINQLKLAKKIQEEAKSLNFTKEQLTNIGLKELAVIEQHAILEEDETLQSMWAKLIVDSVSNNEDKDNLIFMNILKEITPVQAKILKFYYE
ncbi:Abi-alpha family protein, partial [uncultured Campylobacter sp.]